MGTGEVLVKSVTILIGMVMIEALRILERNKRN
jgi:hypothetical protein